MRHAVAATGIHHPAGSPTLRHCCATYLRERGQDIRTTQELLCQRHLNTAMIVNPVVSPEPLGVDRPADVP
jgi:site-specific recombinase XerD